MDTFVRKVLVTIGIIAGVILLPLAFYYLFPHFLPFIAAYLLALIVEPVIQWLMRQFTVKRFAAVNITYFSFLGSIFLLGYFVVTKFTAEILDFIKHLQRNFPEIQAWFFGMYNSVQKSFLLVPPEIAEQTNQALAKLGNELTNTNFIGLVGSHAYNITTLIPNLFILLILIAVSLYLISLNLEHIKRSFFGVFKDRSRHKLELVFKDLRKATIGFLESQVILSSITYIISSIGLMILGVRYALAIALVVVLVDILPILGTGTVFIPWAIYALSKGNTFLGVGLIILFIVINVVRRIIEPKILGERIGLSPLSTLISIWVGFKVLGIAGVFLGPLVIILYRSLVRAGVIRFRVRI
ncbi:sporulation integral membrane protein YtvI [Paradesulfitobacterium aromaticivorans]